jgi:23S rRNA (cytosine1962-C5)-methyltransferase
MAFEAVRVAWPRERLIHADAKILVVDKPRGLPVHGGHPEVFDVVTRLRRFLRESGASDYLSVHSRLDQEVTGVLVFGRDPDDGAALSREFEAHRVVRRYRAIVRDPGLPRRFEMRDQLRPREAGRTEVVRSGGVAAATAVQVLARGNGRALVELLPQTGRRHQLRVQLSSRDAPIAGDALYGGDPANRLLLHAVGVQSETFGWNFESELPEDFNDFGATAALGSRSRLSRAIFDAAWLRQSLLATTETLRLVNAEADALPGVTVDAYGEHAVVELLTEEAVARREDVVASVIELGARSVYVKCRLRRDLRQEDVDHWAPRTPDVGPPAPSPYVVHEAGVPVEVELGDGWDTGLYLDQRDNRKRIRAACAGRSMLNLFGYTGMFSVAAALGGAASTTTVDLSGRALDRARRNFALSNLLTGEQHRFVRADAVEWLSRKRRAGVRFDVIVLDPPSFSTVGKGRVFKLSRAWEGMFEDAIHCLNASGRMLVVSHERDTSANALRHRILEVADRVGRKRVSVREVASAPDFPPSSKGPFPAFALWVELG